MKITKAKMVHVNQENNECSLAVCAMVSGAKYERIQQFAWDQFPARTGKGYFSTQVDIIWEQFNVPFGLVLKDYDNAPVLDMRKLKLNGRGHILYTSRKMPMWHHVAYENGMIYDAQDPKPLKLADWVRDRAFTRIDASPICQIIQREIHTRTE